MPPKVQIGGCQSAPNRGGRCTINIMHLTFLGALIPICFGASEPLATSPHASPLPPLTEPYQWPPDSQPPAESEEASRHQLDFWLGEWSVLNRHLDDQGRWIDGDIARARITPIMGGQAVLEEWAGPFHGSFLNGFSLFSYDPSVKKWSLLLFWTANGDGSFGKLNGTFRHGRGEFIAPDTGPRQTRYSFSDCLSDTMRWDAATTQDSGVTWKTDWIMEFSRTRTPEEVSQENLFQTDWTEGALSTHHEARRLDWLLGTWIGTQTDQLGEKRAARLQTRLLNKDALLLDVLETRANSGIDWSERGGEDAQSRLFVRGWLQGSKTWEGWSLRSQDTRLSHHKGTLGEGGALFELMADVEDQAVSETLRRLGENRLRIEEAVGSGADRRILRTTDLKRVVTNL